MIRLLFECLTEVPDDTVKGCRYRDLYLSMFGIFIS